MDDKPVLLIVHRTNTTKIKALIERGDKLATLFDLRLKNSAGRVSCCAFGATRRAAALLGLWQATSAHSSQKRNRRNAHRRGGYAD